MPPKKKTVEEIFVKKSQLEHIFDLPDTYIGSIENTELDTWIYDDNQDKIIHKNIKYVPGLYKIFDEVLVNAIDQHVRIENDSNIKHKVTEIKVNIDQEKNLLSVYNNGIGIPIVEHQEHKIYIPELIFGQLLTSSNYDKDEKKITGGKNGYGAKLANIFSNSFKLTTVDHERKLKYVQLFEKNMSIKGKPTITKCSEKPYTIIEFEPDLKRFNLESINDDTVNFMKKRVIDCTACTNKNVNVYLNDKKIDCKTLEKYVSYYLDDESEKIHEEINDRWEVVMVVNPEAKFEQVSFVNGISTIKGGKHVDYVVNGLTKKIQTTVSTKGYKRKKIDLKTAHLKDNIFMFVKSTVENPSFDSQIKEYLTTPASKFGSTCVFSDKFIEKVLKTSLVERAIKLNDFKDNLGLQKIGGKKTSNVRGIEKLDDANKAGSNESLNCTLILTEGDSAKALAIAGLSVIGRDYYGVFPLRGKLLNVRDINMKKITDNQEISSLVKIIGLKFQKKKDMNEVTKDLRYGKVLILTDADVDGSHIKGLLINLFSVFWPELLEIPGFLMSLATPIIKAKKQKSVKEFYTMTEFEKWKETIENLNQWNIKYYKGLGTSTSEEAKGYFTDIEQKNIKYLNGDEKIEDTDILKSVQKIELAFDKKKAEDRKFWLKSYDKNNIIEQTQKNVHYHEFIDKELIHFSDYDCKRSIPSLIDGLKPSLRKIIYSCLKRNLKKELKVSQLAGYVSENSAYHHGEQSLYDSIIGIAQNFVGSNNVELLEPKGQFGTRLENGKDSASPRYIFTNLSELAFHIFNPLDNPLLQYNEDDGMKIEPIWYMPIIPLILVNGSEGIGTGFSTKVPCHNPEEVVKNLFNLMDNKPVQQMKPWYRGFQGKIDFKKINEVGAQQYTNNGCYKVLDDTSVFISELPIGKSTEDYKVFLESLLYDKNNESNKQCLVDFTNHSTEKVVKIQLKFKKEVLKDLILNHKFEITFKLTDTKYTNYSNMHLYNNKETICKYDTSDEILREFYGLRLIYYVKRKEHILKVFRKELDIFESKIRFIEGFIDGSIDIINKEDDEINNMLEEMKFPKFGNDENENSFNYDYLLNMRIRTLTKTKIEELKNQHENKLAMCNDIESKDPKDLWKEDLTKFIEVYKKNLKKYNEILKEHIDSDFNKKEKKKKTGKK
jgi:DNA topoisomerase II